VTADDARVSTRTTRVEGIDRWAELGSSTFVPLRCRASSAGFRGVMTATATGPAQLTHLRAGAHEVERTPATIAGNDPGLFKLGLQMRGTGRLAQAGRQAVLHPGDIAVYDTSRPYTLAMDGETTETVILMFPAEEIGVPASRLTGIAGTRLPGDEGVAGLVSPFLGRLADAAAGFDPAVTERLTRTALDLVAALVWQRLGPGTAEPETVQRSRLTVIKLWIESHLDDPALGPESVAAAHHVSVRYLYRIFEGEGTSVARFIKRRRLERCRRDLADPALAGVGAGALAARHGLSDPAGFSRAFRAAYGETPRDFRARHLR
jgi:AraC-like DNA-binding protein